MATYPIFLSYSWAEQDGTERITSLMENYRLRTEDFAYEYYSVSKDDPVQFLPSNACQCHRNPDEEMFLSDHSGGCL